MIRAYDEVYLEDARRALGSLFETAVYSFGYEPDMLYEAFVSSGVAARFGRGDASTVAGKSGAELACLMLSAEGGSFEASKIEPPCGYSREWWAGWALAYYQWFRAMDFADIAKRVPLGRVIMLYDPYHEMDISSFVQCMDALVFGREPETPLAVRRKAAGMSQSQLAALSGVPVRSIQQYEQRQKDLNKAQVGTVAALAQTLCCCVEDLLEKGRRF